MSGNPGPSAGDKRSLRDLGTSHPSAEGSFSEASNDMAPECTQAPWKIQETQKALESSKYIEAEAVQGQGKGSKSRGTSSAAQHPLGHSSSQLLGNQYSPMELDLQNIEIPISNVVHQTNDQLSTSYETYNGRDPCSNQWHAAHLNYLQILFKHLPDIGSIASQHDYLGSMVFTSYEDWRQSFGVDSFGDFLIDDIQFGPAFKDFSKTAFGERHIADATVENFSPDTFENVWQLAQLLSIRDAQLIDGSVFWGTGGTVAMIPDIIQSAFTHCPITDNPGLIDKCLVDIMNMANPFGKACPIPHGYAPADGQPTSATLIARPGAPVQEPHMMSEVNFLGKLTQAALMEDDWNNGDDNDNELEFEVRDSQDTNHEDANAKYAKLFEGLNVDEVAVKKDTLLKTLHEKRGAQDFEQAEEGQCGAVMARNTEMIKKKALHLHTFSSIALVAFLINEDLGDGHATSKIMLRYQSSKANGPSGTDEAAHEIKDKKHKASTN
ncbi:hypothetical protein BS47DRAFT_1361785 [Hydnum rufescens UP504]|uniref:Uncharacterized protein n=1 Tax=Hydnum rufescens UP504 TaxID=1448309 RepID=A0A9P6DUM7_9AGAM|nr:hypothetical protein BS47DRAFT_1361785 [Hydnum rufescens UP504]